MWTEITNKLRPRDKIFIKKEAPDIVRNQKNAVTMLSLGIMKL